MIAVRVAVVGGGLSGLCLAQGLVRDGVEVAVYERDPAPDTRRQGYRIHLDGRAGRALHACLPPELFALLRATLGAPGAAVNVVDQRLRIVHRSPGAPPDPDGDPAAMSAPANRQTLREVLTGGLDGVIRYGREVVDVAEEPDRVTLRFADGSTRDADVLVGADGVGSPVRRRRLPHAQVVDTGARCVYGKTLLTGDSPAPAPAPVADGFTAVIGAGAIGMALGLVRFPERPDRARSAWARPCGSHPWPTTSCGR